MGDRCDCKNSWHDIGRILPAKKKGKPKEKTVPTTKSMQVATNVPQKKASKHATPDYWRGTSKTKESVRVLFRQDREPLISLKVGSHQKCSIPPDRIQSPDASNKIQQCIDVVIQLAKTYAAGEVDLA